VGTDARFAWDGAAHVEAAMFHGAPVWFEVNPRPPMRAASSILGAQGTAYNVVYAALLIVAIILAIRNVRRGSADHRGVRRAATLLATMTITYRFFDAHVTGSTFANAIAAIAGEALYEAAIFCLAYLAIEPYVRRRWPVLLISWQRLVDFRWRDPLVARDFGIGLLNGAFSALLVRITTLLTGGLLAPQMPSRLDAMSSLMKATGWIVHTVPEAMLYALWALLLLVVGRAFLRHPAIYGPIFVIAIGLATSPATGTTAGDIVCGFLITLMLLLALRVGGLLVGCASWIVYHLPDGMPLTLDTNAWFAGRAIVAMLLLVALAAYACICALAPGRRFANVPATA
jgi:hypothetical protein